jgi:hypothetical protein
MLFYIKNQQLQLSHQQKMYSMDQDQQISDSYLIYQYNLIIILLHSVLHFDQFQQLQLLVLA